MALFAAMVVLAAVPSTSVFAVSARAASAGFRHGALTALGIVVGDLVFIFVAVFGLALLAEALGPAFFVVKLAGGAYLIGLGIVVWRSRKGKPGEVGAPGLARWSSFMTGLLITLGDQKAILFYLGFLPAFIDLSMVTAVDVGMIGGITVVAVGGVKAGYAYLAGRAGQMFAGTLGEKMNMLASGVMIGAGVWVIFVGLTRPLT